MPPMGGMRLSLQEDPMADKLIRFTGDAPLDEPPTTGRRSRWWPGEVRAVSEAVALSLIGARQGWRFESPSGAPGALRKETAEAVEALVSGYGKDPLAFTGSPLWDFSTNGSGAVSGSTGATFGLDPSMVVDGKPMMKIVCGAAGTLTFTWTFTEEITLEKLRTFLPTYAFEANATADGASTIFGSVTMWLVKGSQQWRYALPTSGFRAGVPNAINIGAGNATQGWSFGGGTPPTNTSELDAVTITSVRIVITVNAGREEGKAFWFGFATKNRRARGAVSVVLDGQYSSQHLNILPMLEEQGIRGTLAIHAGSVGGSGAMTYAQLDRAKLAGHAFAHHTFNATIGNGYQDSGQYANEDAIYADIAAGFANLEARGYIEAGERYAVHGGGVHPFTNTVGAARQAVVVSAYRRAGTKAIRYGSIVGGSYERLQQLLGPADPYNLQGVIQITSSTTAAAVVAACERARDQGAWAILTVHRSVASLPGSLEMTNADFATWITALGTLMRAGSVDVAPMHEIAAARGLVL